MNVLLDTHVFLWWITEEHQLSETAQSIIRDGKNRLFWSAASSWETAIKYHLGRLPLPEEPGIFLAEELEKNQIDPLPITDAHAFHAGQLPRHHKDPFDRMLIAQADTEALILLSCDAVFDLYDVTVKW